MQRYVRVAAVQALPCSATFEELLDGGDVSHALDLLERATAQEVDIVCFPELYPGRGEEQLRRKARELGVYVICGSRLPLEAGVNGKAHNTATLIDPKGDIVGRQSKVLPTAIEVQSGVVPGQGYTAFSTPLGRIGMIICADLPFSRRGIVELKRQRADIIFNPSWWFALGEAYPASVIGRHLEYGLPIFGVDIAKYALRQRGEDGDVTVFPPAGGYTTAAVTPPCRTVDELGEWFRRKPGGVNAMSDFVSTLREEEDILYATVDLEAVRNFPGYFFSETAEVVARAELTSV